jgi:Mg2+ and Co2+ transporter CorA
MKSNPGKSAASTRFQEKFPQSARLLAQSCGEALDTQTMLLDPFYAITDLFQFCAFSENQFMNLMEAKVKDDTNHNSLTKENPTLSNLLYCQEIVLKHLGHLRKTVKIIECSGGPLWPHVEKIHPHQYQKALRAKDTLLKDYEQLIGRAEVILERCSKGMDVIMNNAMLAESKRAILQAQSVAKLTLIAFFYIPLSFTCSFFSMDIVGFEKTIGQIWVWFAVSIPVLLISISFLSLDRRKLGRAWLTVRSVGRRAGEVK